MKTSHKNNAFLGHFRFKAFLSFTIIAFCCACNKQMDTNTLVPDSTETDTSMVLMYILPLAQYAKEPPLIKRFKVQINKDYAISGKLVSLDDVMDRRSKLPENLMYNVAVFDNDGLFVAERNYNYRNEIKKGGIPLPSNGEYTFVMYSIGSTTYVPNINFPNLKNKSLASATLDLDKTSNFMYFKTKVSLAELPAINQMKIIKSMFDCKFSEVSTTINASNVGQPMTALRSSFGRHFNNVSISLATGDAIKQEKPLPVSVDFPELGTKVVRSSPTIVHSDGDVTFHLSELKVGSLMLDHTISFENLKLSPGVKYKLDLKVEKSGDELLRYEGQPAVRIQGQIWMMDNLGVNFSDPNFNPLGVHHGNFYQYANKNVIAPANVMEQENSKWVIFKNPVFWNSGTEEDPIKSKDDPCPNGFRIPTFTEFELFADNLTFEKDKGNSEAALGTFTFAKVFKSKWGYIEVDFPLQGFFDEKHASNWYRGSKGYFWTSSAENVDGEVYAKVIDYTDGDDAFKYSFFNVSKSKTRAFNIRCIAD